VLAQPCILNLHDLLADLAQDLLPPLVGLIQIVALAGKVRPLLLLAARLCLLPRQEPGK
jgi:hypothetical protein